MITLVRRFSWTMRLPRTHCARSLSGVQMITRSTRGSAAARTAAAASASSASNSTIGQTVTPSAASASSSRPNCESRSGSIPAPVLYPATAVAERLDDVIGGDADVRRPAVDHPEDRRHDAADRAHLTPVLVARRGHRVEVPEQFVGAVDQVNLHRGSGLRLRTRNLGLATSDCKLPRVITDPALLLLVAVLGVALVVVLITVVQLPAFLALATGALAVGLAARMPFAEITRSFQSGVGDTLGFVAMVIGLGTVIGKLLPSPADRPWCRPR